LGGSSGTDRIVRFAAKTPMKDLKNATAIWTKGGLFFIVADVSFLLLLLELRTFKSCLLLGLCVWAFCRAYYFAFYVIEHYVDSGYRFAGLLSFCLYLLRKRLRE
jgi:hypothetical protein